MQKDTRQVAIINGVAIMVDYNNWVKGAASIQAILSLPKVPGFPDYRYDSNEGQVYSTQNGNAIKRLSFIQIDGVTDLGYNLWVDGQSANLTPALIENMLNRGGKTKQEHRPKHNLGVIVVKDRKVFGQFENQEVAEERINQAGSYQVYGLLSSFDVTLQVKIASPEQLVDRFYGIDE